MEITYIIIVGIVTYILGAVTKTFVNEIPNKFIPIQNVLIGVISSLICFFAKIEPNLMQALVLCLTASMSAGGVAGIVKTIKGE
ncbi:MAG: hypothetical protein RR662_07190 [Clostridia bacterium]